ncbi:hypothetical protein P0E52_00180 [Enterococcus faecalis]|uniref:hypothetical protein n=1 Tax=Enterococcus TaxID=1350 RepID=UPI00068ED1A5|nr:hypothetical protein [Enterococcus faecalis]EHQ8839926.1 hypothetical protein [Enterococcus faecalis]MDN3112423.1 hypothetical protein [Enterococcus faecalis]HBI2038615.1 hypothetical protein [Enterococcus faecalis]HBI2080488.1 hypothetical protein [Enterococcus faecalis]
MGFKFSDFYNEQNIELSEKTIEELLLQHMADNNSEIFFSNEIDSFLTSHYDLCQKNYNVSDDTVNSFEKIKKEYSGNYDKLNYSEIKKSVKVAA